jgi:hypothetical protein
MLDSRDLCFGFEIRVARIFFVGLLDIGGLYCLFQFGVPIFAEFGD